MYGKDTWAKGGEREVSLAISLCNVLIYTSMAVVIAAVNQEGARVWNAANRALVPALWRALHYCANWTLNTNKTHTHRREE